MLCSTRLVTISLFIAILCSFAPVVAASPSADFDFSFDFTARIEAFFVDFGKIFSDWTENQENTPPETQEIQAQAETIGGYSDPQGFTDGTDNPGHPDDPQDEVIPYSDPQG